MNILNFVYFYKNYAIRTIVKVELDNISILPDGNVINIEQFTCITPVVTCTISDVVKLKDLPDVNVVPVYSC